MWACRSKRVPPKVGKLQGVMVGLRQESIGRKSRLEDRGDNHFPQEWSFDVFFVAGEKYRGV